MKAYAFVLNPSKINYASSIRSKLNILQILLGIVRYLLVVDEFPTLTEDRWEPKADEVRLVLYIDKMSRVFIYQTDKIHSFYFPFFLKIIDKECTLWYKNEFQITSAVCSILEALFYGVTEESTVEDICERYWDIAAEFKLSAEDTEQCGSLAVQLLSFEPGYLRFDHDEEYYQKYGEKYLDKHKENEKHPVNHFDINYTDGASFKFGLYSAVDDIEFIDVLKSGTPCFYLAPKKQ